VASSVATWNGIVTAAPARRRSRRETFGLRPSPARTAHPGERRPAGNVSQQGSASTGPETRREAVATAARSSRHGRRRLPPPVITTATPALQTITSPTSPAGAPPRTAPKTCTDALLIASSWTARGVLQTVAPKRSPISTTASVTVGNTAQRCRHYCRPTIRSCRRDQPPPTAVACTSPVGCPSRITFRRGRHEALADDLTGCVARTSAYRECRSRCVPGHRSGL